MFWAAQWRVLRRCCRPAKRPHHNRIWVVTRQRVLTEGYEGYPNLAFPTVCFPGARCHLLSPWRRHFRPLWVYFGGGRPLALGAASGPGGREAGRPGTRLPDRGSPQVRAAPIPRASSRQVKGRSTSAVAPTGTQVHADRWVSQERAGSPARVSCL